MGMEFRKCAIYYAHVDSLGTPPKVCTKSTPRKGFTMAVSLILTLNECMKINIGLAKGGNAIARVIKRRYIYDIRSLVYSYHLPKLAKKLVSATLCLSGWWKNSNAWRETLEECFLCFDLTSLDVGYLGQVSLTYLGTACLF